jgi:hypothetical protein
MKARFSAGEEKALRASRTGRLWPDGWSSRTTDLSGSETGLINRYVA